MNAESVAKGQFRYWKHSGFCLYCVGSRRSIDQSRLTEFWLHAGNQSLRTYWPKCNLGTHRLSSEDNLAFYKLWLLHFSALTCRYLFIDISWNVISRSQVANQTVNIDLRTEEEVLAWVSVTHISAGYSGSTKTLAVGQRLNRHQTNSRWALRLQEEWWWFVY